MENVKEVETLTLCNCISGSHLVILYSVLSKNCMLLFFMKQKQLWACEHNAYLIGWPPLFTKRLEHLSEKKKSVTITTCKRLYRAEQKHKQLYIFC